MSDSVRRPLETATDGNVNASTLRGFRDVLRGRLDVLRGEGTCEDCGSRDDLTPGGPSDAIVIRCATCWHWERIKARREQMRNR
jgi:hypothetical protein